MNQLRIDGAEPARPLRCATLTQPWCGLMAAGVKPIEVFWWNDAGTAPILLLPAARQGPRVRLQESVREELLPLSA